MGNNIESPKFEYRNASDENTEISCWMKNNTFPQCVIRTGKNKPREIIYPCGHFSLIVWKEISLLDKPSNFIKEALDKNPKCDVCQIKQRL